MLSFKLFYVYSNTDMVFNFDVILINYDEFGAQYDVNHEPRQLRHNWKG
jgi:hypothetical protein